MQIFGRLAAAIAIVGQMLIGPICAVSLPVFVAAPAVAAADEDCCPAGSHPPGQCPLHRASPKGGSHHPAGTPTLRCCCQTADLFLAATAPAVVTITIVEPQLVGVAIVSSGSIPLDPHLASTSPPPRA